MIVLPSLSEDGWVSTDGRQGAILFSHIFLSDYSQTYVYDGEVTSLAWMVATCQGDTSKLNSLAKSTLERYFGRYFAEVVVETKTDPDPNNPSKYGLTIYLSYTGKDGVRYNLGKMAQVDNDIIKKVVNLNNYGTDQFKEI